jgi:hypothetical protein
MSDHEMLKPGPTKYTLQSEFDKNRTSKQYLKNGKGFSFTEPYKKYEKVFHEYQEINKGKGPDAGLYNVKSFVDLLKSNNKRFSIGMRIPSNDSFERFERNKSPGPTTYNIIPTSGINKDGKFPLSKDKNL